MSIGSLSASQEQFASTSAVEATDTSRIMSLALNSDSRHARKHTSAILNSGELPKHDTPGYSDTEHTSIFTAEGAFEIRGTFAPSEKYDFSDRDYPSPTASPASDNSTKTIPWTRHEDRSTVSTKFFVTYEGVKRTERTVKTLINRGYPIASILGNMGNFGIKDMEYGSIITKEFVDGSLQPVFLQFYSEKDFYEVLDALEEWQPVTRGSITMKSGLGKKYQGPVHWFPVVYDAYGNDISKPNWWKPFLGHDE